MTTLFISHNWKDKAWADRVHALLQDAGYQGLYLDFHPDDGTHAGADWERTLYQRIRQARAVIALCSADWLASPWCVAEAMLTREQGKKVFLIAAAGLEKDPRGLSIPEFLRDGQVLDLGALKEDEADRRLLAGLQKEGLKAKDFPLPDRPYPGLLAFQESDAAVYFGRDDEIDAVRWVLNRRRASNAEGFVLILGASGCGKSSLVRAGVLPWLRRATAGGGGKPVWVIVPPVMGGRGLEGLALALEASFGDTRKRRPLDRIRKTLNKPESLAALGTELLAAHGAPEGSVLIVVDQLEEVFGTDGGSRARAMLRLLLDTAALEGSPVTVLATMRSDFLNAFQLFEGAAERYEKVTLDPMLPGRFGAVIEGPADRFGVDIEPGLTERMVADTAYRDALPLLAFTLEKLFERCAANNRLTIRAYEDLDGVSGAVARAADTILAETGFAGLGPDDPRLRDLRRAFFRMVQVGGDGQIARQLAPLRQMPPSCEAVLKRFVERRLLVTGEAEREPVIGVAHEALLRTWGTLAGWLQADTVALSLRSQIEHAAGEWWDAGRAANRAWQDDRILDAVREIGRSGVSLNDERDSDTVNAFLGPTDQSELEVLPGLSSADDEANGSGRYGAAWRLPLAHEARASVGVRLAILGDRRKGVGLREDGLPDIDWVEIPGGTVSIEIRKDPRNPNSEVEKEIERRVGGFRMARYPVTLVQFEAFLAACHKDGAWHLPPGFPANPPPEYTPPKPRTRFANHPVDSVNWYDAQAFCHWLSARLEPGIRLPRDEEWQLAATGGRADRAYPWGPDWDIAAEPWRANTFESELDRSTAVGLYPSGAAPSGLLDMAGTVWEWCQNVFDDPDDVSFSVPDDERVLRGGSWNNSPDAARAGSRGRNHPNNRGGNIGFRVVVSSPSSGG